MPLFQLKTLVSNVANGQNFEKLLSLNEAQENLWAIYGPIAVNSLSAMDGRDHPLLN